MKKPTFVIKYKYFESPWIEWARTMVPSMVDHYEHGCRLEQPAADVKTFKE